MCLYSWLYLIRANTSKGRGEASIHMFASCHHKSPRMTRGSAPFMAREISVVEPKCNFGQFEAFKQQLLLSIL